MASKSRNLPKKTDPTEHYTSDSGFRVEIRVAEKVVFLEDVFEFEMKHNEEALTIYLAKEPTLPEGEPKREPQTYQYREGTEPVLTEQFDPENPVNDPKPQEVDESENPPGDEFDPANPVSDPQPQEADERDGDEVLQRVHDGDRSKKK